VLAALHRRERDRGVHVIRDDHRDRVDALLLVEHLAEVLVLRRLVESREPFSAPRPVHVGERDDVLGAQRAEDTGRPAAGADPGDMHLLVGRLVAEELQ
jgi:hypothetical protein